VQAIQSLQLVTSKEIIAGADSFVYSVSGRIRMMIAWAVEGGVEVP